MRCLGPSHLRDSILLNVPEHNVIIATVQRAASTSMLKALSPWPERYLTAEQAAEKRAAGVDVVMWIRDPYARLTSMLRLMRRGPRAGRPTIDRMFKREDVHWKPQMHLHTWQGEPIPNIVYPFEALAETWPIHVPSFPLGKKNVTKLHDLELDDVCTPEHYTMLTQYYASDLAKREELL